MRVFVTGAAGFIGSSVCDALLARGDEVIGIDNFNSFYDPAIKEANIQEVEGARHQGQFQLVRADLVKGEGALKAVFEQYQFDAVCHLAAWAGVRPSIEKPLTYYQNNVEGTVRLLELAKVHGIKPFIFASSSSVYGARKEVPFREDDRVDDPVSPYAATKKAGELAGFTYHHLHGLDFTALRFFTVYGPRQRPEMAIHLFAERIMNGEPIKMFGDGKSSRDYTYIDDCVDGVVRAIDSTVKDGGYRIYNLGHSETTELANLIEQIETAVGKKAIVERHPDQPGDVPRTFADISRAKADFGYDPRTPVTEGVPKFVAWLEKRRAERE